MAPKKKTITAISSSGAERPVPVRASGGAVADGSRGTAREHPHRSGSQSLASGVVHARDDGPHATKSKDGAGPPAGGAGPSKGGAVPPTGGAATSKSPMPVPTTRSSQGARDEQRHHAGDPGHRSGKSPVLCSTRGTEEANMPTEVLAEMAYSRRAVMELLLTWLGVEACHGPRSFRRHPRQ